MSDSLRSMIEKRRDAARREAAECEALLGGKLPGDPAVEVSAPIPGLADTVRRRGPQQVREVQPPKRVRSPETKAKHAATLAAKKAAKLAANGHAPVEA